MLHILRSRFLQKHRTMVYPCGAPPDMPDRFIGRPVVTGSCPQDCRVCHEICPVGAIRFEAGQMELDMGRCLFCRTCVDVCPCGSIRFGRSHQLAAAAREELIVSAGSPPRGAALSELAHKFFSRSLKLRQVSAGGCNACEADSNVLITPAWDIGRFGIQFVASPRHADGLLITGPLTENMRLAVKKTYAAVPEPRVVIAVGACAIGGGPYVDHPEVKNGADAMLPVDLYIPGCPPHPLTILDGLLRFLGRYRLE